MHLPNVRPVPCRAPHLERKPVQEGQGHWAGGRSWSPSAQKNSEEVKQTGQRTPGSIVTNEEPERDLPPRFSR